MTDLTKIPVTVITGFLGAGKTTLIRHLMQNPQGKRLAILVNEFGTVGVDGDILKSCADDEALAAAAERLHRRTGERVAAPASDLADLPRAERRHHVRPRLRKREHGKALGRAAVRVVAGSAHVLHVAGRAGHRCRGEALAGEG